VTAVSPGGLFSCLETDDICDSRKFVSNHLYPPMVGWDWVACEIL
jgi:hypothetical protein